MGWGYRDSARGKVDFLACLACGSKVLARLAFCPLKSMLILLKFEASSIILLFSRVLMHRKHRKCRLFELPAPHGRFWLSLYTMDLYCRTISKITLFELDWRGVQGDQTR